jgi:hypothetical protein
MAKSGKMSDSMSVMKKDYQPGAKEFAGSMMGKANEYIERTEKRMDKDAGRVRSQAYKGRYD